MTWVLVFHSTNLNGPVPTGARLKSGPIFATAVGDTMPMQYMASVRRIGPYGSLVTTSTVRSSTTSAPSSEPARLAQRAGGVPRSARSNVNFTAAALKGVPSWNFTAGRSLKRTFVGDMTSYDVASAGLTCILSSSVRSPSSMLKYTQAPGAVVSRFGSSETGSVGRTIVRVPPRFCASAAGTSAAASPSTRHPISNRERRVGRMRWLLSLESRVSRRSLTQEVVGRRGGGVERVNRTVALANERRPHELERVGIGIERRQLADALQAGERRKRQRQIVREPVAARVAERYQHPREPHEAAVDRVEPRRRCARGEGGEGGGDPVEPVDQRARAVDRGRQIESRSGGRLQGLQLGEQAPRGAPMVERQHRRVQPAQRGGEVDLGVQHQHVRVDLVDRVVLRVPPPREARAPDETLHGARQVGVLLGQPRQRHEGRRHSGAPERLVARAREAS